MDRPYVEWMRVEDYRCIRSVDVHLTPLHAFIGPNDSGKSSLLRAIQGVGGTIRFWVSGGIGGYQRALGQPHEFGGAYDRMEPGRPDFWEQKVLPAVRDLALLRLDPDELRQPARLIPSGTPLWFSSERGRGLAALYDALQTRDFDRYVATSRRFVELFPCVRALRLQNPTDSTKALGITLMDGSDVAASEMSEGMLYWLSFAIIESLAPRAILLIEEPENGLHPARIAEVMKVLRAMSERMQIIVATHSPLVINELQAEEVTIVTRTPERGTICTPMTATKNFAERSKIYALGELWLSYADGELEKELVGDDPPAKAAAAS